MKTTDKDESFLVGERGCRHAKVDIYSSGQLSKGERGSTHLPLDTVLFRESRKIIHLIVLHRPCWCSPFASNISSSYSSPSIPLLNRRKVRGKNRKGVRKEGRKKGRKEGRKEEETRWEEEGLEAKEKQALEKHWKAATKAAEMGH